MKIQNVPSLLLKTMNKLYGNIRTKLITPDGGTENFKVTSGVLQGDTLAPCIFARPHFVPNIQSRKLELGF